MVENLVVVHDNQRLDVLPRGKEWLSWSTCLRQIALGFTANEPLLSAPHLEVYYDLEGYKFLLEVICGLKSPIIGETEVMGQFKDLVAEVSKGPFSGDSRFSRLFKNLATDAKKVREGALKNLGSQSYGSLVRQNLKGVQSVCVLGTGRLVEELLPWLDGIPVVSVLGRNPTQRKKLQGQHPKIQTRDLTLKNFADLPSDSALVIAAPLSGAEIRDLLKPSLLSKVIDLRENSSRDPLKGLEVLSLSGLFGQLEQSRTHLNSKVQHAHQLILKCLEDLGQSAEFRPFGWEDLCG